MRNRNKMELVIGLVIFTLLGGIFAQEPGLSEQDQIELIDSLQNYISTQNGSAKSELEIQSNAGQPCPDIPYSEDKYCLERKYISNGYYVVRINFIKLEQFAEQPHAPLIRSVRPFRRDTSDRDAYLDAVSDAVFREYIGQDYNRFHNIDLIMVNAKNVVIELQVKEAAELQKVLLNPHINYVKHIGNPEVRLEEITH